MLSLAENPPPRFPADRPLADDRGLWMVIHAKPRQEKAVARELLHAGLSYYLPLIEKRIRRRDNGKVRKSLVPLFSGYLAAAVPEERKAELYGTERIAHILPVLDQDRFLLELGQIERVLASKAAIELVSRFRPGQAVRVRGGPFLGMEGKVLRKKDGTTRLVIQVQMFKQGIALEMDETFLDPA